MGALDYTEHYTLDDYRLWEGDWELIDGSAYAMSPSPMVTHQSVSDILTCKADFDFSSIWRR